MEKELMTIKEAAAAMRISTAAVRALVKAGKVPHVRPTLGGRRVLLRSADVAAHVERCTVMGDAHAEPVLKWIKLR
jgi:excisionase family DNA binding protein